MWEETAHPKFALQSLLETFPVFHAWMEYRQERDFEIHRDLDGLKIRASWASVKLKNLVNYIYEPNLQLRNVITVVQDVIVPADSINLTVNPFSTWEP